MIGIYKLTCTPTGKEYVGAAAIIHDNPLFYLPSLQQGIHPNEQLQNDFTEYGTSVFTFEPLYHFKNNKITFRMLSDSLTSFRKKANKMYECVDRKIVVDDITITPYTKRDYTGRYNLKEAERDLIFYTAIKMANSRKHMAERLKVSDRALYRKIIYHSLQDII